MTYQVGGLIEANDYNSIINLGVATTPPTPAVNVVWAAGATNTGYGQPTLTTATAGTVVSSGKWNQLMSAILNSASHQGTALSPFNNPNPVAGEIVEWEAPMYSNMRAIYNNRLNANLQGPVIYSTITNGAISWSNQLNMTWTVTWPSNDQARFYFNAGGQLGLSFQHNDSSSVMNQSFRRIAGTFGTIWLSSTNSGTVTLMNTVYNGVTQVGGLPADTTINSNLGFYGLISSDQLLASHVDDNSAYYYYTNSYISILGRYNGAGVLTLTAQWVESPSGSAVVAPGSIGFLAIRPPALVFLANSWNGPTVTTSIAGS